MSAFITCTAKRIQVTPHPKGPGVWIDPFEMDNQERGLWCWAAVAHAAARHHDKLSPPAKQCDVATMTLNQGDCCLDCRTCNTRKELELALQKVGHFRPPIHPPFRHFSDLRNEVHRFICLRILLRPPDDAHFVAVEGAFICRGDEMVSVGDPTKATTKWIPFKLLHRHYERRARWTDTYFTS